MSKVAGKRWGALVLGVVAARPGYAGTPVRRVLDRGLLGVGFTLVAMATALADGRTPGSFAVSPAGEARYSVPIFAPPGVNGLVPRLALSYAHQHPGTLAGVGWGVSGLSAIHRCGKTYAQNGVAAAPQNALDDRYCLDGMQLRLYSGSHGAPGSSYRTELESYSRITAIGSAGNGPASFKVELGNGLIYEYGNTPDSQVLSLGQTEARAWALNRMSDRAGNQVIFAWHDDTVNGSYRIDRVDYLANSIDFQWESKPVGEVRSGFVTGSPVREIHRLRAIEVTQSSSILRRYELSYEGPLSSTSRSRLASIRECAGQQCRDPTSFEYRDGSTGLLGEVNSATPVPAGAIPLDVNGDGREDLVFVSNATAGAGTWRVMLANTSGSYDAAIDSQQSNQNYSGAIPIDHNHDGLGDILVPYNGSTWWVMLGSADGLRQLTNTNAPATTTGRGSNAAAIDVDGDGRDDLVWADLVGFRADNNGDAIRYRLRSASGAGFSSAVSVLVAPQPAEQRILTGVFAGWTQRQSKRVPDFNGDGRGDVAWRHERRTWNAELGGYDYTRTVRALCVGGGCSFSQNLRGGSGTPSFGDFNGDGLTDLFYYSGQIDDQVNSATWWYALSRGTSFAPPIQHANINNFTLDWVILDWDADGHDDVLAGYGTTGEWRLLRATGEGFGAWTSVGLSIQSGTATLVLDLDGDGLTDLGYVRGGTLHYRRHAGTTPDLLSRVTDGYGNAVAVTYAPLTAPGVHARTIGSTFPEQEWQGPMHVVVRHEASDGIGGTYRIEHAYEGARLHRQGRGFEGFLRHTRIDDRNGITAHEYYARLFPHTGSPDLTELRQSNNALVHSRDLLLASTLLHSGIESRTVPYVSRTTSRSHGVGSSHNGTLLRTVVTDTLVDAETGTPVDISVTTTEAAGANGIHPGATWSERTINSNLYTNTAGGNWCVGRPQRSQRTNSHSLYGGTSQSRTQAVAWDPIYCRPLQQVLEPDHVQWRVQTDLAYDAFGNPETRTESAGAGVIPRTWRTNWGTDGLYPVTVTNPLGQATTRTFDGRFGTLMSETDPNGLRTTWAHDGYGRRTRETRPDQTRTEWTYAECANACGQNRLVVTMTEKSTSGGTVRSDSTQFDTFDRPVLARTQLLGSGYRRVEQQYDDLGRLMRRSAPCVEGACPAPLYWTTISYDLLGRATLVSRPFTAQVAQTVTVAYAGLATTTTDPIGKLTVHVEDGRGRIARSTDHAGYGQAFDHDAFGRPVRVVDSAGRVLQQATFNVRGLRESVVDADLGTWRYAYNALGELSTHTDANGRTTRYAWDALGRPLIHEMPEGTGSISRTWTWGTSATAREIGHLRESQVSGAGISTYRERYGYDSLGRAAQTEYLQGSSSLGTVNFAYQPTTGLLDTLTYPSSTAGYRLKLKYDYDSGLLRRVRDFNAPSTIFWEATTMDAYGQVLDEALGNGIKTIRGVEPRTGQLDSIESGPPSDPAARQNLEYTWDKAGNLTSRRDMGQAITESFEYDDLLRLERVTRNSLETLSLTYDFTGNILTQSGVGTYEYDPIKLHAVTTVSSAGAAASTFAYDANGNMTSRNGSELQWYADNRLKRVRKTPTSASNSSEFQYGPDGQRWYHKYNASGTIYTHVNLGGLLEIVTRGAIDDYRHAIHANGVPIALYSRKSTGINTLRYLLRDHLGSVDVITTGTGAVELKENFSAFGQRRGHNWSGSAPAADIAVLRDISRRGFTDHEHLDSTALVHMNGRVYDPVIARFVSADPYIDGVMYTQGWNRYSYVGNNPQSFVDPSGFDANATRPDGPPESPPDSVFDSFCFGSANSRVCWGGFRFLDNARLNDLNFSSALTWERAFGIFHRRQLSRAGTENYAPTLGQAAGMDFGAVADAFAAFTNWWSMDSIVSSCSIGCAKAWNGDPNDGLAPQDNTASNGERTLSALSGVAGLYPYGVVARLGASGGSAASTVVRLTSSGGLVRRFELPVERVYYRVFSDSSAGKWVTAVPPRSGAWARDALSLPPGNTAAFLQEVRVPAGTLLERSRALRVPEWGRMRGGAEQFQLLDEVPLGNFGPGVPLP